jgi:S-DNA-T family DNA segregation ATPase FtsK/SpoIIIE
MAENTYKSNTFKKPEKKGKGKSKTKFSIAFLKDPRFNLAIGFLLLIISIYLLAAFVSFLFTGKADQSVVEAWGDGTATLTETDNWLGLGGAIVSEYIMHHWLGISAFFIPPILFLIGFRMTFKKELLPIFPSFVLCLFSGLWLSLLLGYITLGISGSTEISFLAGGLGYELAYISNGLLGWGTFLLLILSLIIFIIYFFNVTVINLFPIQDPKPMGNDAILPDDSLTPTYTDDRDNWTEIKDPEIAPKPDLEVVLKKSEPEMESHTEIPLEVSDIKPEKSTKEPEFTIAETKTEAEVKADLLVEESGFYDPTLDLGSYKYPTLELLNEYEPGKVQVTQEELNQNKDKIISTLINFKIGIQSIKATIGPTVTLYEIVPDAGIKISRIKNLEDDIALSLAALGIRIIAPIPGKGTIGIEVPNKNREMVSIRSVLSTEKFQKSDKELPVALGKTISNEVLVIDLAKMPHLLVAGATGQGKSVGINSILVSLLYKKHPSQLKFILVDPKKVELSLYEALEKHFLAKLPGEARQSI